MQTDVILVTFYYLISFPLETEFHSEAAIYMPDELFTTTTDQYSFNRRNLTAE